MEQQEQTKSGRKDRPILGSVALFYGLAYVFSWSLWLLLIAFPDLGSRLSFLLQLGAYGPLLAAIVTILITGGRQRLKQWLRTTFRWRIPFFWYLLAGYLLPALIALAHLGLYLILGGEVTLSQDPPWYFVMAAFPLNVLIAAPIGSGLSEEPGWQGFGLPRLAARFHPLIATSIHAFLWATWHLPAFFTSWDGKQQPLFWFFAYVIPLSMIIFWLTCNARGSVIPAILLHTSTNLYGSYYLSESLFTNPLSGNFTEIKSVIYWGIALVLIVATKGWLGYAREEEARGTEMETGMEMGWSG